MTASTFGCNFKLQLTLEQHGGWGTNAPQSQKSMCNLVCPWNPRFLRIHGSTTVDSTNLGLWSTLVFIDTIEKNACISGPLQLKPVLFKGQLDRLSKIQPLLEISTATTLDQTRMRTTATACTSGLCPDFWQSTLHTAVRGVPVNCKSERRTRSNGASTQRARQGCSPASPRSWPPLPSCPHTATQLPPEGLHSCFLHADFPFPNIFNPRSLPSLCSKATLSGSSRWTPCLNWQPPFPSSSAFLRSTYHHLTYHI